MTELVLTLVESRSARKFESFITIHLLLVLVYITLRVPAAFKGEKNVWQAPKQMAGCY